LRALNAHARLGLVPFFWSQTLRKAWLVCCAIGLSPTAYAQELSFSEALANASVDGPTIDAGAARVEAARRERRAAGRLPDPALVLAYENFPITGPDRLRLNRDEMTMSRVGLMQEMPSGAERRARRAVADANIARADAGLEVARLEARLGAADAWIKLYYAERRLSLLERLSGEARAWAEASRARLSAGGGSIDDAIEAEIDAARTEDRRGEAHAAMIASRAELRRWIGSSADRSLDASAPAFAIHPEHLRDQVSRHPALAAFAAERGAAEAELRGARAERWPDWSWEISYGRRAPELEDMASIEIRIGLPLLQSWRQGPVIDARRADLNRVTAERAALEREHLALLEAQLAEHRALSANVARARDTRLVLARRRAEAAQGAYAGGASSVADLFTAREQALEAELDVLDLEERLARIGAALTLQYLEQTP
jgi:outer membrane protein TolC